MSMLQWHNSLSKRQTPDNFTIYYLSLCTELLGHKETLLVWTEGIRNDTALEYIYILTCTYSSAYSICPTSASYLETAVFWSLMPQLVTKAIHSIMDVWIEWIQFSSISAELESHLCIKFSFLYLIYMENFYLMSPDKPIFAAELF